MRKVVVSQLISLDGVFVHPEFSMPYHSFGHTEQMAVKLAELRAADALLFGRITYEGMAASWPQMAAIGGEYAELMNSTTATVREVVRYLSPRSKVGGGGTGWLLRWG